MKNLLTLNAGLTIILFIWGSIVRAKGAGLACPDWPLCHGKIIPPFETLILLEWGHRLLASSVGVLTLTIGVIAIRSQKYRKSLGLLAILSMCVLIFQVILGALTVKGMLHPSFVAAHMAIGFLFLALLLEMLLTVKRSHAVFQSHLKVSQKKIVGFACVITFLIYLQIVLGALVSSSHAGLACPDFPTCLGNWFPKGSDLLIYLHFSHRILAFVILIVSFIFYLFISSLSWDKQIRKSVMAIFILALIQITLGIANVFMKLPLWITVSHAGLATVFFAVTFVVFYKVRHA